MNTQNELAIRYQDSINDRERNKIIKELIPYYMPRIHSKMASFSERDQDELVSLYNLKLLTALSKWDRKNGILFTTYWWNWVTKAISETRRLFQNRDTLYSSLDEYEETDDEGYN